MSGQTAVDEDGAYRFAVTRGRYRVSVGVCMYARIYNALNSNSLSSHECAPVGQTEKMCL